MTRDGERIIELILFLSITATLLMGSNPDESFDQRWGFLNHISGIQTQQTAGLIDPQAIANHRYKQLVAPVRAVEEPQIEKISGLKDLDRLFFAKPLNPVKHEMVRQSC